MMDKKKNQNQEAKDDRALILEGVEQVQGSRAYKLLLMRKRFLEQIIHGTWAEKKDFVRWIWSKIIHKDNGSKWLQEFDPLQDVRERVERGATRVQAKSPDHAHLRFKHGRRVFIFAGLYYYDIGGGQRSAQLARVFNDMGYSVYYLYLIYSGSESLSVISRDIYCPTSLHCNVDSFPVAQLNQTARNDSIFIFEAPSEKFIPYLEYAKERGIYTVYEHIDNWDTSLGNSFGFKEEFLRRFVENVSLVTVTARLLGEKIAAVSQRAYLYLPNAVNSALFEPTHTYEKPRDLVQGEKTLLYFGSLWGEWFDWEKVIYVAKNCACEINLIGDYAMLEKKMEGLPSNIHFLGKKPQNALPAYLAHSDIAILPFKNSDIGKYVSPLKIFEYIAMNKPVLATPLDDISGYPNVYASDDKESWAKAVMGEWTVTDAGVFTAKNSWYARCNEILAQAGSVRGNLPAVSVIVPSCNGGNGIIRCVSSLLSFNDCYNCEIIVVDNGSTDGSCEELVEQYGEQITLLRNKGMRGASGLNMGVQAAQGEYLFFMEHDQWAVSASYLDNALSILTEEETVGAVGWSAGWFSPARCLGPCVDDLPQRGIITPNVLFRKDLPYLMFGGMMVRKELLDTLGGFDEAYQSECFAAIDLSLQVKHAGYDLAYCPYTQIAQLPDHVDRVNDLPRTAPADQTYFKEKWNGTDPYLLRKYIQ